VSPLRRDGDDVLLSCKVQPRSRDNAFAEVRNHEIVVKLKAPPVDGKANEGLVRFVAKTFDVAANRVRIERGEHSRHKLIRITRVHTTPTELRRLGIDDID
jgi:hypothetical protein